MYTETTETKTTKRTDMIPSVELSDDQLNAVSGGYTREEWAMILKEMNKLDGC